MRRRRPSPARPSAEAARSPSAAGRGGSGRSVRLVPAQPEQLGRGEAGQRPVARQLDQPRRGRRAPRSRRTRHPCAGRSRGSPAGSPRSASSRTTSPCIWPERPMPATSRPSETSASAASDARHQSVGILLRPAGLWRRERIAVLGLREHLPVGRDRDRLDTGRADVDADERSVMPRAPPRPGRAGAPRSTAPAPARPRGSCRLSAYRALRLLAGSERPAQLVQHPEAVESREGRQRHRSAERSRGPLERDAAAERIAERRRPSSAARRCRRAPSRRSRTSVRRARPSSPRIRATAPPRA